MSTYTIAFQCGHIHNDACQQCEENANYNPPDSCPQFLYQNLRMPSFGTLPDLELGDDDDDNESTEGQDPSAWYDNNESTEGQNSDAYYEEDESERDYESDEDTLFGDEGNSNHLSLSEGPGAAMTVPDGAVKLTIITDLVSEDLQKSVSPLDRELPNYIRNRNVATSRPVVVVQRTRRFSESAQIEEVPR